MTIIASLIVVIIIGVLVTRPSSNYSDEIVISKDYKPGDEIASSLNSNTSVNQDSTNKDTADIENDNSSQEVTNNGIIESSNTDISDTQNETNIDSVNINESTIEPTVEQINTEIVTTSDDNKGTNSSAEGQEVVEESSEFADIEIPNGLTEEQEIQFVKDKWVDEMIHENQSEIDQGDLSQGATIYNQLDTGYIFGLAKDGLTEAEKLEAMTYLEANLSAAQIETAQALFSKYIGLVNQ